MADPVAQQVEAGELAYVVSLQERAAAIQAIFNDFAAFLRERYNLGEGDSIDSETGIITRVQHGDEEETIRA